MHLKLSRARFLSSEATILTHLEVQNWGRKLVSKMLKVNETVTGYDLGELLHGEAGLFEAIAPGGDKFQCVARAGHSITNLRPLGDFKKAAALTWRVRKIGELRSEQDTA